MKNKNNSLLLMGGVELLNKGEQALDLIFSKTKKVKDVLLAKLNHKTKKATQNKQAKQQISQKIQQRDAEITMANYSIQKLENQRITKARLSELEHGDSDKQLEHEQ